MKSGYLVHFFAGITLLLGVWIFVKDDNHDDTTALTNNQIKDKSSVTSAADPTQSSKKMPASDNSMEELHDQPVPGSLSELNKTNTQGAEDDSPEKNPDEIDPQVIASDYIAAWKNRDKQKIDQLWASISECKKCLLEFVDLVVNNKLEEGLLLEVAIKLTKLDTDVVLPIFDTLIDPMGNRSTAIILSEKLINNGRPEFVKKIFEIIYRADENGYKDFSRQLTWVISKIDNQKGIEPILDIIIGRQLSSPKFSTHVSNVFSKVVPNLPDSSNAGGVIANYYSQANGQEQQRLWQVTSQHGGALVSLAINADKNGRHYNVQKYANAITKLPHLQSVDSMMQLHTSVEYSPDYLQGMLSDRVADNPTIKVLHKLEDYMRDPNVKIESRIFAAEGLLAIKQNRQARYILEKVINNTQEPDAELQAHIGGRL